MNYSGIGWLAYYVVVIIIVSDFTKGAVAIFELKNPEASVLSAKVTSSEDCFLSSAESGRHWPSWAIHIMFQPKFAELMTFSSQKRTLRAAASNPSFGSSGNANFHHLRNFKNIGVQVMQKSCLRSANDCNKHTYLTIRTGQ